MPEPTAPPNGSTLLETQDLRTWFPVKKGFLQRVVGQIKAVDGIDLAIRRGETLGLVGESGCGKSTLGRTLIRLERATGGSVRYREGGSMVDLLALPRERMFEMRRRVQIIFQDPFSSLNPRMPVGEVVGEYLLIHKLPNRQQRIETLLASVGLSSDYLYRYPHEFSGGQRQRIGIARALSLEPEFIVCDEPVSALDVSVQAQIIRLLRNLQRELGLTFLFISHDLTVVHHLSDRVAVMYVGKLVEYGPADRVYRRPRHPYSEALLASIPRYRPAAAAQERVLLEGDVPSPANPAPGCRFHPRCRYAESICRQEVPPLVPVDGEPGHFAACHFAEQLRLAGITPPSAGSTPTTEEEPNGT